MECYQNWRHELRGWAKVCNWLGAVGWCRWAGEYVHELYCVACVWFVSNNTPIYGRHGSGLTCLPGVMTSYRGAGRHAAPLASIRRAVGRLTARSREVSKPRDSGLNFSNRSEIWQVPRQHCCRGACQISELYDHCNIQSRGFETSRDLVVRRLTA